MNDRIDVKGICMVKFNGEKPSHVNAILPCVRDLT